MNVAAPKRYLVEWTPWDAVKAAAVKRGMPDDGEVADYVEIDDYQTERVFSTFSAAVKFASSVANSDTWRCPRIRRQVLVQNDHDDLGNRVKPMPSFETEATWEMIDGAEPTEDQPDWLEDAA